MVEARHWQRPDVSVSLILLVGVHCHSPMKMMFKDSKEKKTLLFPASVPSVSRSVPVVRQVLWVQLVLTGLDSESLVQ